MRYHRLDFCNRGGDFAAALADPAASKTEHFSFLIKGYSEKTAKFGPNSINRLGPASECLTAGDCCIRGGLTIERDLPANTRLWLTGWTRKIMGGEVVSLLVEIAEQDGRPRE